MPGGRKRSCESARKAARSSPWSSSFRVSAPTISLRKMATASAWSFGASGGVLGIGGGAAGVDGSISAPLDRLAGGGESKGGAVPGGRSSAEGSSMVGPPPPAPPRRWTSGYMLAPRNAADSMESPPAPGAHGAGPPAQARPPCRRGGADDPERAHAAPDLARCERRDAVQRECQRDRGRRVQPAPQHTARDDHHNRAARLALIPANQDPDQLG